MPVISKNVIAKVFVTVFFIASLTLPAANAAADSCTPPSTDLGTDTASVSVPTAGTYQAWSRIKAPGGTSNEYLLDIDGSSCYLVGGGNIPANTWTWVDYDDGNTNSPIDVPLTAGTHTIEMIGTQSGVELDNLIFTADTSCVPTGTGTNCSNPPDTTPPAVSITAPQNGATVSGTVNIEATATDSAGITQVQYLVDGNVVKTDSAVPYDYPLDTTTLSNGAHSITAEAFDTAGNTASSDISVTVQNGSVTPPPTAPSSLTATAAAYDKVNLTWTASSDSSGIAGYYILRDGTNIEQIGSSATSYSDTSTAADTTYNYQVEAFDGSGNVSTPSNTATVVTPSAPPSVGNSPPPAPTDIAGDVINAGQVNLTWTASSDANVIGYSIDRSTDNGTPAQIANVTATSYGDANLTPDTVYTYFIEAYDAAGNISAPSKSVTVTTPAATVVSTGSDTVGSDTAGGGSNTGSATGSSTTAESFTSGSNTSATSATTESTTASNPTTGSGRAGNSGGSKKHRRQKTTTTEASTTTTCHIAYQHWWQRMEIWKYGSCTSAPGGVSGTVSGSSRPLTGATVWLKVNERRTEINTTNATGNYTISGLAPGTYTISYSGNGFTAKTTQIKVSANRISTANIALTKPGGSL